MRMVRPHPAPRAAFEQQPEPEAWRDWAVCRAADPEQFFDRPVKAKAICDRCPVESECLEWALRTGQAWGVFGGLDADERADLLAEGVAR